MPENNKSLLHQGLVEQKLYTQDFRAFEEQFSTPESQNLLHQAMVKEELYTKDLPADQSQFFNGVAKKKVGATTGSEKELSEDQKRQAQEQLETPVAYEEEGPIGTGEVIAAQEHRLSPDHQEQTPDPATKQGRVTSFLGSINQRVYGLPGKLLKGISIGGAKIESLIEGKELNAQEDPLHKVGQWYQNQIKEIAPRNKEFQGELQESVGQAMGDLIGLVGGGVAVRALRSVPQLLKLAKSAGIPVWEAAKLVAKGMISPEGIIGATQMGVSEYEQAKEGGASDADAFDLFIKNAAVGSVLERMPVQLFWRRLDTVTGGGMKTLLKKGFSGGMEEGITEVMQQAYSNKQAQQVYDETRTIIDGMGEAGGIGFGLGFVLNAMGVRLRGLKSETTSKEDIAKIQEAIDLTTEKQNEVNKEADKIEETVKSEQQYKPGDQVELEVTKQEGEVAEQSVDVAPEEGVIETKVLPTIGGGEAEFLIHKNPYLAVDVYEKTGEVTEGIPITELNDPKAVQSRIDDLLHDKELDPDVPTQDINEAIEFLKQYVVPEPTIKEILTVETESDKLFKRAQEIQRQASEIKEKWHTAQGKFKKNTPKNVIAEAKKISNEFNEVQKKYEESLPKDGERGPYAQKVMDLGTQERALIENPTQEGYDAFIQAETDFFLEGHQGTPESSANQARFESRLFEINEKVEGDITKVDPEEYVEAQYQELVKKKPVPKKVPEAKKVETKPVETEKVQKAKQEIEEKLKEEREVATGKVVLETQDYIPIKNLKGKEVKMKVEVEETGKMETITMSAIEVQTDIKKRHKILEKLTDCVG